LPQNTPAGGRRRLALAFVIVFLDLLGASVLIPVVPYIVREYRTDATTVGLLSLSYSAAQFFAAPILGTLSDRYGRRPVLLASILGSAAGYFLFGLARTLELLFIARILDGLTGGNISAAQAYIADVSAPQDRAKNFGLIGAAFGLGFIMGPAFGGVLSHISLQAPAYGAGILTLATFALAVFFLPESLPEERRKQGPARLRDLDTFRQIAGPLRRAELRPLLLAGFTFSFAMSGMQSNFAVFTMHRFGLSPAANAVIFMWIGATAAITQGLLVRKAMPRWGERRLATGGLGLSICGFLLIAFTPRLWLVYPAAAVVALGTGLAGPALTGLVSRRVAPNEQGHILGVNMSLGSLARVFGPLWAGAMFDLASTGAPYWSGALWLAAGAVLLGAGARGERQDS
jgi:multidrug resistance protein